MQARGCRLQVVVVTDAQKAQLLVALRGERPNHTPKLVAWFSRIVAEEKQEGEDEPDHD